MRGWRSSLALSAAMLSTGFAVQAKPLAKQPAASKSAKDQPAAKTPKTATPAAEKPTKPETADAKPAEAEPAAAEQGGAATELNSPAMLGTGVVFTVLGTAGVVGSVSWMYHRSEAYSYVHFSNVAPIIGIAGGSALIVAGIPLWIAGAWEVPAESEPGETGLRLAPIVGPTGGGLRGTF